MTYAPPPRKANLSKPLAAASLLAMSYATLEVELRDGRVIPREGETLPATARALLVLLNAKTPSPEAVDDVSRSVSRIRARQAARGYSPRCADAVNRQVRRERESWA
jgi:hypothetical protein